MNAVKLFCCCASVFLFCTAAQQGASAQQNQQVSRRDFQSAIFRATAFSERQSSPDGLGSWQEVINNAVFTIFRSTELYRGEIILRVVEKEAVSLRFYPNGVFELSTGLLDFIDETLFASAGSSARRMRQIDAEREEMLLPFVAAEAGLFAADAEFSVYSRAAAMRGKKAAEERRPVFSERETFLADICAVSLLSTSGVFVPYREWLDFIRDESRGNSALRAYTARFPDFGIRAENLSGELSAPDNAAVKLNAIVNALKTGFGSDGASKAADDLEETIPELVYLHRLKAMLAHREWEKSAYKNGADARILSMLPFAQNLDAGRTAALRDYAEREKSGATGGFRCLPSAVKPAGDERLYRRATDAYKKVCGVYSDFTLNAALAFLEAQTASESELPALISIAAEAALKEAGSSSVTARVNYARLLFLCGKDIPLAARIMEEIFSANGMRAGKEADTAYVSPGFPGDARTAAVLSAAVLQRNGKGDIANRILGAYTPAAENTEETSGSPALPAAASERPLFKSIGLGDTADIVATAWGEPSEIAFNTESETWTYPELHAQTVFIPIPYQDETSGLYTGSAEISVMLKLFPNSSVSLPGELRTGDSKNDFEAAFGEPLYRADDAYIYLYGGLRFKVSYSCDGKAGNPSVRTVSVSF